MTLESEGLLERHQIRTVKRLSPPLAVGDRPGEPLRSPVTAHRGPSTAAAKVAGTTISGSTTRQIASYSWSVIVVGPCRSWSHGDGVASHYQGFQYFYEDP